MTDDATLKTVQLFACSILCEFFISELVFLFLSTLIYVSENDWRFLYRGAIFYPLTASLITKQWPISSERMKQYNQKGTVLPCFKPYTKAINKSLILHGRPGVVRFVVFMRFKHWSAATLSFHNVPWTVLTLSRFVSYFNTSVPLLRRKANLTGWSLKRDSGTCLQFGCSCQHSYLEAQILGPEWIPVPGFCQSEDVNNVILLFCRCGVIFHHIAYVITHKIVFYFNYISVYMSSLKFI